MNDEAKPPPAGSNRLPGSIACEPQPPCVNCEVTTGGAAPSDRGALDKEIIRRIIQRHVDEARACYEAVLERHPAAAGRVQLRFGIAPSGRVGTSCLESSSMHEEAVENCVVALPFRWTFPVPQGGGWVVVTYPFVFTPG
jgi:hypothetical protein